MNTLQQVRFVWKPVVFLLALLPALLVVTDALEITGRLSANPVEDILDRFGNWGLRFIMITLAVTPLRRVTGWSWLTRFRRMLRLFTFFYIVMHFLTWFVLDQGMLLSAIVEDIIERPFITIGILALLLLVPLAVTSTNGMMRRLGRRWQSLHRLIYPIAILGVWHFWWQVKQDIREPLIYASVLGALLGFMVYRLRVANMARTRLLLERNRTIKRQVEEQTRARPGEGWGFFFRLNPDVDDVVERFVIVAPDAVRLLVMGNTVQPAAGCLCPENALLAAVVNAIALRPEEAILMDTQAGFEHFGRALARGFLHAVVVTDPTFNGVQAALHAARLARDLEIGAIHLVVNSVRDQAGFDLTMSRLEQDGHFPFASIHQVPYDERLRISEPSVEPVLADPSAPLMRSLAGVMATLTGGDSPLPETDHAFDPAIRQIAEEWGDRLPCVSLS